MNDTSKNLIDLESVKEMPHDLIEPNFNENSIKIMSKRHLLRDEKGNPIETPKDMFWRVASTLALEDAKYVKGAIQRKNKAVLKTAKDFYTVMASNKYLPGSRVLYEAGNKVDGTGQLASCFVLPIEDSLEHIFQVMKEAAIVQKNNGGTGFNFSHIRPKGDSVGGTPNVAAGPLHFIKTFSQAFDQILQGKKRGGGNMAILNVNHPDILEFIHLKEKDNTIRNFNISVGITDDFMNKVKNDEEYELINPRNGNVIKKLKARAVFDEICDVAYRSADPGIFFLDTAQKANPTPELGIIEATNPCGEEPLRAYESCNLGSVVLPSHVISVNGKYEIDWESLRNTIHTGMHLLDNMIDNSRFTLNQIQKEVALTRKSGLGFMGFSSLLYKLGIPYNSEKAIKLMDKIGKFIATECQNESVELAKERGVFPGFKGSVWDKKGIKVRNATFTSIAPTGTISLLANVSSGIEPVFSLVYQVSMFYQDDSKEDKKSLLFVEKEFESYAKEQGFYSKELMEKIAKNNGSLKGIKGLPKEAYEIFVTTHEISYDWHVLMQAAAQKHIDAAVSKTINLPADSTIDDVKKAYILAWETKCKGITIYRDGSKQDQVLGKIGESKIKDEVKTISKSIIKNQLTPNAIEVLGKRALSKSDSGEILETPEELWRRIASYIASAEIPDLREEFTSKFEEIMNNGEFLCGGTLIWAGMGKDTVISKCLVLPINDSIDSIFQSLNWNIQCLRRGVGTGFNFSKIRSSYSKVSSTGEFAAGPIEYIRMYNRAQDTIRGRGGRGLGSMAILNADHPNILDFIASKDDLVSITHYNISVGASDKFMKAVKNSQEWDLIDPHDGKVYQTINARDLFEEIAKKAWQSGDPGMFFLDNAEKGNTTPSLGKMNATNPCGEQPLIPFETCNMGHINLSKFVMGFPLIGEDNIQKMSIADKLQFINWDRLKVVIEYAVRFLDDVIDINHYPIKEIEEMTKRTRNIGVGIMGFADLLIKLGVSYGNDESITIAEEVMKFIQKSAHQASVDLGFEKGSFPEFQNSTWASQGIKAMRNTRVTTIAPTGTISIIANCNPGIEPIFALGYRRKNSMGGADQEVVDPLIKEVAESLGFYSEEFIHEIASGKHLNEISDKYNVPKYIVDVFKTTHEIDPEQHVFIQAAFQKHIDSAVSKTINLPNNATWQDIARIYTLAYELKCKGITVFRDGSKDPALQVGTKKKTEDIKPIPITTPEIPRNQLEPRKREEFTNGRTYEVKTEQGDLYVTINSDSKGIVEVFLNLGKSGSFTAGYTEAMGRLISMSLRSGIMPKMIIKQLQGIRTSTPTLNKGMIVYSVPDAVAKIMKKHLESEAQQIKLIPDPKNIINLEIPVIEDKPLINDVPEEKIVAILPKTESAVKDTAPIFENEEHSHYSKSNEFGDLFECPECGSDLEYAEGCILCRSCGFSKCG